MTVLLVFIGFIATVLLVLTLPGSLYLLFISLSALRKQSVQPSVTDKSTSLGRLAIIVPAHNEASGILRTLSNLGRLAQADGQTDVIVIADNCDDDTGRIATEAGFRVMERHNENFRGKGYALDFAFKLLMPESYDAYLGAQT